MEEKTLSRWWRVVGGLSMNLALGSLYAWSVFVAPLEKEFGWKRADTSMIFTIAVFVFALSFILAGRLQDKKGPFWISVTGGVLVSVGFFLSAWTTSLAWIFFWFGVDRRHRQRLRLRDADPRHGQVVPRSGGAWRSGSRSRATAADPPSSARWPELADPDLRVAGHLPVLGVIFFVMTLVGAFLLKNPPAGYRPAGWAPAPAAKAAATTYDFSPGEALQDARHATSCGSPTPSAPSAGLMVISQLVPFATQRGDSAALADHGHLSSAPSATPPAGSSRAGCPTPSAA